MLYNVNYDICAFIILGILFCLYLTRRNAPTRRNKTFKALLIGTTISTICDFLTGIIYSMPYRFSNVTSNIVTIIYFISTNALPLLFFFFAKAVADKQEEKISFSLIVTFLFIYFIGVVLIILSPIKHFIFTIDSFGKYSRESGLYYLYFISALYFLSGIAVLLKARHEIPLQKLVTTFSFVILVIISVIIQLIKPTELVENFFISISLLLIYLYIQKPEDLIDNITSLFNQSAFLIMSDKDIKEKQLIIIGLAIEDLSFLNTTFSVKVINSLLRDVANYLISLTKDNKINIYSLNQGRFCLTFKHPKGMTESQAADIMMSYTDKILSRFKDSWTKKEIDINLFCRISIFSYNDFSKADDVIDIIDTLATGETYHNNILTTAAKIDRNKKQRFIYLDSLIKNCLRNNFLSVFYQPIFSTKDDKVIGAEALVRMHDEFDVYISPEEFIPIAEKNGCINSIGEYVFDSVCKMLRSINPIEYGIEKIDVNLSVVQCMQKSLSDLILTIAYSYQIPLKLINLEITETAAAIFPEMLKQNMHRLADSGFELSLDDYGSGYANMNYLLSLPFKMIKIDKEIVWASFNNEKSKIALKATITMIHEIGMTVLAEGVETEEQKNVLTEFGCDYLQGYYFSKPIPQKEFLEYLLEETKKNPNKQNEIPKELEPISDDNLEELESID